MKVTGEQVREAMIGANVVRVPHHSCSFCGFQTHYVRVNSDLYFNSGCGCLWHGSSPRTWQSAADWINMQTDGAIRDRIASAFGLAADQHTSGHSGEGEEGA